MAGGYIATFFGSATTIAINGSRSVYDGPKEWLNKVKLGAKFSNALGSIGLMFTAYSIYKDGFTTSNNLDAFFGIVSFGGPIGAGIAGIYFGANLITIGVTGESIGEHVDNNFYIVPAGLPGLPFLAIPKR
jgi:hypothetical protein